MYTVPLDVPSHKSSQFHTNMKALLQKNGSSLLYAVDHKIEHLHDDFSHLPHPSIQHCFSIAQKSKAQTLATHLGLITRYAQQFPNLTYVAKLNGKTHLLPTESHDPISNMLWDIEHIIRLQQEHNIHIAGIGYTIYLGSKHEATMLQQAAHVISQAHYHGLAAIIWCYPRGQHVQEVTPHLLAGAAGVATSLGADFVKLPLPKVNNVIAPYASFQQIYDAAGNTKILYSGGSKQQTNQFLQQARHLQSYPFAGYAVGRNIYQLSNQEAVHVADTLYDMLSLQNTSALFDTNLAHHQTEL